MTSAPSIVGGPAAWKGSAFDFRREALHALTAAENAEIDRALAHLEDAGDLDLPAITPATFPLPTVGPLLDRLGDRLRHGSGVVLLRGLDRGRYSADQMSRIYYGLGAHLGSAVPQSHHGELLGSVIDISDADPTVRGYQAGGKQGFHTDGTACDIVSLMCLRAAKSGGASRIVSAVALHDALVERRPDLAQVFYDGYVYRKMDLDAARGGIDPVSPEPVQVFARDGDDFFCNLNGGDIRRAVERGSASLSDPQIEAYEELQRLAGSEEFFLDMEIGEGDIQFLNNRTILHSRLGYEDHDEIGRRRHMLRLWLEVPGWPARPARQVVFTFALARRWGRNRTPNMELPSAFLAAKSAELAERARAGLPTERMQPYATAGLRHLAGAGAAQ